MQNFISTIVTFVPLCDKIKKTGYSWTLCIVYDDYKCNKKLYKEN